MRGTPRVQRMQRMQRNTIKADLDFEPSFACKFFMTVHDAKSMYLSRHVTVETPEVDSVIDNMALL